MRNRIKEVRLAKGIRQNELSVMVNVSQPYLSDLENNRRGAKPDTMKRIADAMKVPITELYEG